MTDSMITWVVFENPREGWISPTEEPSEDDGYEECRPAKIRSREQLDALFDDLREAGNRVWGDEGSR